MRAKRLELKRMPSARDACPIQALSSPSQLSTNKAINLQSRPPDSSRESNERLAIASALTSHAVCAPIQFLINAMSVSTSHVAYLVGRGSRSVQDIHIACVLCLALLHLRDCVILYLHSIAMSHLALILIQRR